MKPLCRYSALSLLILIFLPWLAVSQPGRNVTCTGSVFNDSNRNGLRDHGEKGIAGVAVLVNVFAGSDRSVVEMKAGPDGNWTTMAPVKTVDPACLQMHQLTPYLRETVLGKLLDQVLGWAMDFPSVSHHMWEARLPQGLTPGTHTVSVRTTDMYGQTYTSHRVFRIRNEKKEFH